MKNENKKNLFNNLNLTDNTHIATLCKGHGCCPELHINIREKDNFILTDDYGGYVKLTKEELFILTDIIKELM